LAADVLLLNSRLAVAVGAICAVLKDLTDLPSLGPGMPFCIRVHEQVLSAAARARHLDPAHGQAPVFAELRWDPLKPPGWLTLPLLAAGDEAQDPVGKQPRLAPCCRQ
jgi:hypothetical protein